jgi:hypothetical protein
MLFWRGSRHDYHKLHIRGQQMANKIVVADRGWVFIGNVLTDSNGDQIINEAKVIRVWGTTKGLGEIALTGLTPKTILDEAGTVRIPARSVVALFDCKW